MTARDLIKCLKQINLPILLLPFAPISLIPSNLSNMVYVGISRGVHGPGGAVAGYAIGTRVSLESGLETICNTRDTFQMVNQE